MSCKIHPFVRVACIALWVVAAVNLLPTGWGWDLDPDPALFVVAGACVTSYAWISYAHSRPAVEMYLTGKDAGYREAVQQLQSANVAQIEARRGLRAIKGGA